jgi:endonuclease YncB( thermonuclease family)
MPTYLPRPRRFFLRPRLLAYAALVGLALVALHASYRDQFDEILAPFTAERRAARTDPGPPKLPSVVKLDTDTRSSGPKVIDLGPAATGAISGTVAPTRIRVVDGDTIDIDGQPYRLVGYNTPDPGPSAKCAAERELAARTVRRLRQIVAGGNLRLQRVSCGCPAGTEGTDRCNHGRLCAVLTAGDRDVGQILIGEGLARRYNCLADRCPPKQSWCA